MPPPVATPHTVGGFEPLRTIRCFTYPIMLLLGTRTVVFRRRLPFRHLTQNSHVTTINLPLRFTGQLLGGSTNCLLKLNLSGNRHVPSLRKVPINRIRNG